MDSLQRNDTRQPFQQALSLMLQEGDVRATTDVFPVPSGNRLVIENISLLGLIPPGQTVFAYVTTVVNTVEVRHTLVLMRQGEVEGQDLFVTNQLTRVYADADTMVLLTVSRAGVTGSGSVEAAFSGYLVASWCSELHDTTM